jgi:hypothetical protein
MVNLKPLTDSQPRNIVNLGLFIVVLSSGLLAIWAMQNTIAGRNILLWLGCLLSITYLYFRSTLSIGKITIINFLPLMWIGLFFCWLLFHYFFLSQDKGVQLNELDSIWLRSFLAVLLGWSTGLAISDNPRRLYLLGFGLVIGFVVLYCQYIPRAWESGQWAQVDYSSYIFFGKINGVLVGTLLIAGAGGAIIDHLRIGKFNTASIIFLLVSVVLMAMPLFAYVFMFDAKNGIGLSLILLSLWLLWGFITFFLRSSRSTYLQPTHKSKMPIWIVLLAFIAISFIFAFFTKLHVQKHPEWSNFIEEVSESVQVDKYPHWRNLSTMGYPVLPSGKRVTANIFERVSWATVGWRSIPKNPWGNGILQYPLQRSLTIQYPGLERNSLPGSSHSGWIDLSLSFGLLGLFCIWAALLSIAYLAVRRTSSTSGVVLSLVAAIFCLYTVGELSNHHAVEILFYFMALLAALNVVPTIVRRHSVRQEKCFVIEN